MRFLVSFSKARQRACRRFERTSGLGEWCMVNAETVHTGWNQIDLPKLAFFRPPPRIPFWPPSQSSTRGLLMMLAASRSRTAWRHMYFGSSAWQRAADLFHQLLIAE